MCEKLIFFILLQYLLICENVYFPPSITSVSSGCFDLISYCYNWQQQQLQTNYLEIEPTCSYCSNNQFSCRNDTRCVSCQNQKLEECYSNKTSVKSSYWRSEHSNYLDRVYYCSLNEKSCQGQNRQGLLNDLCSEGYIGVMCLGCDFWNTQYGSSGYYQCVSCSSLNNNTLVFSILSCFSFMLLIFTLYQNFLRMVNQVYRDYLSKLGFIQIGTSFVSQSLGSNINLQFIVIFSCTAIVLRLRIIVISQINNTFFHKPIKLVWIFF
ncbi:hypothetical protein ABPG72_007980 [Tetrahymena utriculariae]